MNGLMILNGGLQSSIQDAGRVGVSDIGLTQSGAMDELAFGYVQMLLGNAFNTSTIEIALGGLSFKAQGRVCIALGGADMGCTLNGQAISMWTTYNLMDGDILSFGFASAGHFAYVGVVGGFQTPKLYGSYSTSMKEGLGGIEGRKLSAGDFLACAPSQLKEKRYLKQEFVPNYGEEVNLRLVLGYQEALFDEAQKEAFFNTVYTYKGEGDRMGYRLSGEKIVPKVNGILSEPICYGAVQIPTHGEPIVLLKEHQTIGGYPKIGSVLSMDCFKLSQIKPGGRVRFKVISQNEAQAIAQAFYHFFRF
ncbi:MAG: biotin-dependent carboxyltransferase family protein [Sulfurospirillaceae bacterium]|nr:biotin-dependent carboxyltransferase family protein [Sulfurospirillaceae bacterium]MDD2826290.1 biotin-dependent carboxyltransferase family protein [Sulfurospirillaceae bacterium]